MNADRLFPRRDENSEFEDGSNRLQPRQQLLSSREEYDNLDTRTPLADQFADGERTRYSDNINSVTTANPSGDSPSWSSLLRRNNEDDSEVVQNLRAESSQDQLSPSVGYGGPGYISNSEAVYTPVYESQGIGSQGIGSYETGLFDPFEGLEEGSETEPSDEAADAELASLQEEIRTLRGTLGQQENSKKTANNFQFSESNSNSNTINSAEEESELDDPALVSSPGRPQRLREPEAFEDNNGGNYAAAGRSNTNYALPPRNYAESDWNDDRTNDNLPASVNNHAESTFVDSTSNDSVSPVDSRRSLRLDSAPSLSARPPQSNDPEEPQAHYSLLGRVVNYFSPESRGSEESRIASNTPIKAEVEIQSSDSHDRQNAADSETSEFPRRTSEHDEYQVQHASRSSITDDGSDQIQHPGPNSNIDEEPVANSNYYVNLNTVNSGESDDRNTNTNSLLQSLAANNNVNNINHNVFSSAHTSSGHVSNTEASPTCAPCPVAPVCPTTPGPSEPPGPPVPTATRVQSCGQSVEILEQLYAAAGQGSGDNLDSDADPLDASDLPDTTEEEKHGANLQRAEEAVEACLQDLQSGFREITSVRDNLQKTYDEMRAQVEANQTALSQMEEELACAKRNETEINGWLVDVEQMLEGVRENCDPQEVGVGNTDSPQIHRSQYLSKSVGKMVWGSMGSSTGEAGRQDLLGHHDKVAADLHSWIDVARDWDCQEDEAKLETMKTDLTTRLNAVEDKIAVLESQIAAIRAGLEAPAITALDQYNYERNYYYESPDGSPTGGRSNLTDFDSLLNNANSSATSTPVIQEKLQDAIDDLTAQLALIDDFFGKFSLWGVCSPSQYPARTMYGDGPGYWRDYFAEGSDLLGGGQSSNSISSSISSPALEEFFHNLYGRCAFSAQSLPGGIGDGGIVTNSDTVLADDSTGRFSVTLNLMGLVNQRNPQLTRVLLQSSIVDQHEIFVAAAKEALSTDDWLTAYYALDVNATEVTLVEEDLAADNDNNSLFWKSKITAAFRLVSRHLMAASINSPPLSPDWLPAATEDREQLPSADLSSLVQTVRSSSTQKRSSSTQEVNTGSRKAVSVTRSQVELYRARQVDSHSSSSGSYLLSAGRLAENLSTEGEDSQLSAKDLRGPLLQSVLRETMPELLLNAVKKKLRELSLDSKVVALVGVVQLPTTLPPLPISTTGTATGTVTDNDATAVTTTIPADHPTVLMNVSNVTFSVHTTQTQGAITKNPTDVATTTTSGAAVTTGTAVTTGIAETTGAAVTTPTPTEGRSSTEIYLNFMLTGFLAIGLTCDMIKLLLSGICYDLATQQVVSDPEAATEVLLDCMAFMESMTCETSGGAGLLQVEKTKRSFKQLLPGVEGPSNNSTFLSSGGSYTEYQVGVHVTLKLTTLTSGGGSPALRAPEAVAAALTESAKRALIEMQEYQRTIASGVIGSTANSIPPLALLPHPIPVLPMEVELHLDQGPFDFAAIKTAILAAVEEQISASEGDGGARIFIAGGSTDDSSSTVNSNDNGAMNANASIQPNPRPVGYSTGAPPPINEFQRPNVLYSSHVFHVAVPVVLPLRDAASGETLINKKTERAVLALAIAEAFQKKLRDPIGASRVRLNPRVASWKLQSGEEALALLEKAADGAERVRSEQETFDLLFEKCGNTPDAASSAGLRWEHRKTTELCESATRVLGVIATHSITAGCGTSTGSGDAASGDVQAAGLTETVELLRTSSQGSIIPPLAEWQRSVEGAVGQECQAWADARKQVRTTLYNSAFPSPSQCDGQTETDLLRKAEILKGCSRGILVARAQALGRTGKLSEGKLEQAQAGGKLLEDDSIISLCQNLQAHATDCAANPETQLFLTEIAQVLKHTKDKLQEEEPDLVDLW